MPKNPYAETPAGTLRKLNDEWKKHHTWVSPTGHDDPSGVWIDEINAYDDNLVTYATCNVPKQSWSGWLVLTHAALTCDKIRYYLNSIMHADINDMIVEVEKDGSWTEIFHGAPVLGSWVEKTFTEGSVTGMHLKFYNSGSLINWAAMPCEVDFWEVPPPVVWGGSALPQLQMAKAILEL